MKLRNKINLNTAVLFTILLILMNISIYFLFNNLLINSELETAREEMKMTSMTFNKYLETIPEKELLRSYLPVEGMIRIVRPDTKKSSAVTTLNEKELSKQKVEYYSGEISKKINKNKRIYAFHSMPIILPDGNIANLQITKSLEKSIENLQTLRLVLFIVTLLALIPVFISSRLLSNLLINPVTSMIKTMSEIKESGQFKRLPLEEESKDELYQMGETFNHMIDLLETNFEKQKQFVSNASHELKTPLTVIESYASLLKRRGLREPEIFNESIEAILSESIRMREMTEQLLLLAKHNEQWDLKLTNLNLLDVLKQTVKGFQNAYNRDVVIEVEQLTSTFVTTDEQKLKQLLFIFLDNARKYSDDIITTSVGVEKNEAYIKIIDRGIGIPEEALPKIFDRFYRVDQARSRKSGGSGLGLSLAKEIAEAIDVRVTLESKEKAGTTVTLTINK
ncbi:HAMP domain-containing sensor histidine kinase [Bacillus sp. DTU_2020_1000418_1_SI_GHA_SEK_038]|uniref:sensor histidine kinase n=1 Tax=Bacillus sp. DTU_2020_1000418_1_SI_GHA_SEK_038 TaxID=3077585 RepID=UPI0028EBBBEF|nr:HAMP domain-containing sensor histidine kinase [Bacillus sp. DTU_2020_1000418_1_SI_GHA_SEK_038]WNS76714.1 HAMP domain-containing sensor histidine kinase [Bacillus sp. DTU_2020_1000418_1_SI_GHA_SEK_038]